MSYNSGIIFIEALGWNIAIIDIVLVAFVLIMAFVGLSKGFTKVFFSVFGTIIVIVGAVLLASKVGGWLTGPFGHFVNEPATTWINNLIGNMSQANQTLFNTTFNWSDPAMLDQSVTILAALGLPATLAGFISDTGLFNQAISSMGETSLAEGLPRAVTSVAMTIIAFILLLIVFGIIMGIIKNLFKRLTSHGFFGGINRFFGFLLGIAEAYLLISVIFTVVALFPAEGFMSTFYQQVDASFITKALIENNWIGQWLMTTIFKM